MTPAADGGLEEEGMSYKDAIVKALHTTVPHESTYEAAADVLIAALESAGYCIEQGWRPITAPPVCPMDVLLFWGHPGAFINHLTGEPADVPDGCRYDVCYWDGSKWYWHGSNHDVFEFGKQVGDQNAPTHWRPLAARPQEPKE